MPQRQDNCKNNHILTDKTCYLDQSSGMYRVDGTLILRRQYKECVKERRIAKPYIKKWPNKKLGRPKKVLKSEEYYY